MKMRIASVGVFGSIVVLIKPAFFGGALSLFGALHLHAAQSRAGASQTESPCSERLGTGLKAAVPEWSNDVSQRDLVRESWRAEAFTNPRLHDPHRFRYVVKVVTAPNLSASSIQLQIARLSETLLFSASVISNAFTGVFSIQDWGFILAIPPSNIVASAPFDMNSRETESRRLDPEELFRSFGLHSVDALLRENIFAQGRVDRRAVRAGLATWNDPRSWNAGAWNEVKFWGRRPEPQILRSTGDAVHVTGLFHKRRHPLKGAPSTPEQALSHLAFELGLPLIAVD